MASVSEKLLESVSYTKTPQGIIVLAQRPASSEERLTASLNANSLLVVLHQINNPVNVGAILRTAEAAGASGVITTRNTSDPYSPKSLRGAMGSAFRLPIWTGPDYSEMIAWCRQRGLATVCADVEASVSYTQLDWTKPSALLLGPESTGFTDEELAEANQRVSIPMKGAAESLNVSVAAGILLFEAARQRNRSSEAGAGSRRSLPAPADCSCPSVPCPCYSTLIQTSVAGNALETLLILIHATIV